jgi:hypothetical protein
LEDPLLRIDENSGTLVAPQAGGLVTENSPDRDELLALVGASWEAFAHELGLSGVRLVARDPAPGVDLLGIDEPTGRPVIVYVTGEQVEWQLGRALAAAADVAGWDAARLAEATGSEAAAPHADSPQLVLVAGGWDPRALATVQWLARHHRLKISAFTVSVLRFGSERLLSVHREPREAESPDPVDWLLSGVQPAAALASTPPPGL